MAPGTQSLAETDYDVLSRTPRTVAAYHLAPPCPVGLWPLPVAFASRRKM
jgi:hypothetical protein